MRLFPVEEEGFVPKIRGRGGKRLRRLGVDVSDDDLRAQKEATTLDRVHAAMLLQASGRANALSALYPKGCEEKRLLDAMLLAVLR